MIGWRFVATPRWLGYISLAVVFAIVCCLLGSWQFARRAEARAEIHRIDTNYESAPVPVEDVLPQLGSYKESQKWKPVLLKGEYLKDEQLIVRNRPLNGRPGFEVLTPFLLQDGTVFIVDRGWLPIGSDTRAPDYVPPPPDGPVSVTARLKASEPSIPGRSDPPGTNQVATIQLSAIAQRLHRPTYTGAYGLLIDEHYASGQPVTAERPIAAFKPVRDEGPHLSYALQWFVFAILGFIGLGWALRQEYRVLNADDPAVRAAAEARARKKAARAPTDADVEDSLLDGQDSESVREQDRNQERVRSTSLRE